DRGMCGSGAEVEAPRGDALHLGDHSGARVFPRLDRFFQQGIHVTPPNAVIPSAAEREGSFSYLRSGSFAVCAAQDDSKSTSISSILISAVRVLATGQRFAAANNFSRWSVVSTPRRRIFTVKR